MADSIVARLRHASATSITARSTLAAVVLIAGSASYFHALDVIQAVDGTGVVTYFLPLLADLVITSGALNLLDASRSGDGIPVLSVIAVVVGALASLGGNVASTYPHEVPAWLVNGWIPLAFGLAFEPLVGTFRRSHTRARELAELGGPECPHTIPESLDAAVITAFEHARDCLGDPQTYRAIGRQFNMHHATAAKLINPGQSEVAAEPEPAASASA